MTDQKSFIDYIGEAPIKATKGRWRKYSHAETDFDRVTYAATWKLTGSKSVTVKIIGATFWDLLRGRGRNDFRLHSMTVKSYKFYGLITNEEAISLAELSEDTKQNIMRRVVDTAVNAQFDVANLNKYL